MRSRLDLFGTIHIDRRSKVESELTDYVEDAAHALFAEKPSSEDTRRAWLGACLLRNLVRPVDFLIFYFVGFVTMALTKRRQRLGDLLAGTEVRLIE